MAIIAPFRGLTYDFDFRKDFPRLVTPPYDVISEEDQRLYYRQSPYNMIRLILGRKKTGDSDWDNPYTRAADYFSRWRSGGILTRADQPCIYLTSLTYVPAEGNAQRTRWGLIALVRIEEQDSRVILPHERTFSTHKDDRLKLMRACNAQFSQIFALYEDRDHSVLDLCREAAAETPQIAFQFRDGTKHQMWILADRALFRAMANAMREKPIIIADGHHRYETARNYRDLMRARYGVRPKNRSYEFVMTYLSNMHDEGLSILPSHRLIRMGSPFHPERFLEDVATWFDIEEVPFTSPDLSRNCLDFKARLEEAGHLNTAIGFYGQKANGWTLFSLKPNSWEQTGTDLHPAMRRLDVVVLSRLILQKCLGFSKREMDNEEIFHYESSIEKAIQQVQSGKYQMAFLLNPTRIEQVVEIARNRLIMPRKSTYFYPKVLTGLVLNTIDPHEIIQVF